MAVKVEDDLRKYIRQQIELGYDRIYLPMASRTQALARSPRKLPMEKFADAKSLEQLEKTIVDCKRCRLWENAHKLVFGTGDPDADIMFVGEGPGRDEDLQGEPFVGRAGKLLDKMLDQVGIRRDDVYIANVVKHRPPENRDPLADEVEACEVYLHMQIKFIKPKVICCLGRISAQTLLRSKMTLTEMRKRWFEYQGTRLMVTYHPAAILRAMTYLEPALDDLRKMLVEVEKIRGRGI